MWGGSRPGRSPNKDLDFEGAYRRIVADYFNGTDSVYDETDFDRHRHWWTCYAGEGKKRESPFLFTGALPARVEIA